MLQTITWTGDAARLLDQTKLPTETVYVDITDERQMWDAIRRLVVRGAPAIGVAAAFGVYLGVRDFEGERPAAFLRRLDEVCDYLATSRPTAVNLFWALDRMRASPATPGATPAALDAVPRRRPDQGTRSWTNAWRCSRRTTRVCRAIGEHGVALLEELADDRDAARSHVLTHCNAGGLATVQYGTALAPIYVGAERGVQVPRLRRRDPPAAAGQPASPRRSCSRTASPSR